MANEICGFSKLYKNAKTLEELKEYSKMIWGYQKMLRNDEKLGKIWKKITKTKMIKH